MNKKIFLVFITLIAIIIIKPIKVNADEGPIMWIDCPVVGEQFADNTGYLDPKITVSFARVTESNKTKWYLYTGSGLMPVKDCWAKTFDSKKLRDKGYYICEAKKSYKAVDMLNEGKCPTAIIKEMNGTGIYLAGETDATNIARLTTGEYYFTGYGNTSYTYRGYYYDKEGKLCTVRPSVEKSATYSSVIPDYQKEAIKKAHSNFFHFDHVDNKKIFEEIDGNYNSKWYKTQFGNGVKGVNHDIVEDSVAKWYQSNSTNLGGSIEAYSFRNNKQELINTCTAFNEKNASGDTYEFGSYTANDLLNDLKDAKNTLKNFQNNKLTLCSDPNTEAKAYNSATNCVIYDLFSDAVDAGSSSINYHVIDEIYDEDNFTLHQYIYHDISNILLEKYNLLDETDGIEDILVTLGTTVSYLNKYAEKYNLDKEETSKLRAEYEEILSKAGITVVVDCESLFGQELIDKINSYLNIIKIAIPILVIGFGVFDFAKATFAGTEDQMQKAQKDFIKRIGIAILIFLTPTIVHFILLLANKVWINISPDSCGLF